MPVLRNIVAENTQYNHAPGTTLAAYGRAIVMRPHNTAHTPRPDRCACQDGQKDRRITSF